jgi:hypothetical protein
MPKPEISSMLAEAGIGDGSTFAYDSPVYLRALELVALQINPRRLEHIGLLPTHVALAIVHAQQSQWRQELDHMVADDATFPGHVYASTIRPGAVVIRAIVDLGYNNSTGWWTMANLDWMADAKKAAEAQIAVIVALDGLQTWARIKPDDPIPFSPWLFVVIDLILGRQSQKLLRQYREDPKGFGQMVVDVFRRADELLAPGQGDGDADVASL